MSRVGASPVDLRNYSLERHIEDETATYEDGTDFVWQFDRRMKIVEPLIRDSAHFGVDISKLLKVPSPLDEGEAVLDCIKGVYDIEEARSWVFSYLYQHAINQANATYVLFSTSHVSQGFQLWRSLFETHIICEFLNQHISNSGLFQDYISHSLLWSWIHMKKEVNALCRRGGAQQKYGESEISDCEKLYESKNWKLHEYYAWAKPALKTKRVTFRDILSQVDSDMAAFYRLSSMELHPTIGQRFAALGVSLPLPAVPVFPIGVVNQEELQLDFLTAKVLHRVTGRTEDFVQLNEDLRVRYESLMAMGERILASRRRATSPTILGSRRSVKRRAV